MSGLAGVVFTDGRQVEPTLLHAMVRASPHSTLDGAHIWNDGPVGLIRFALATTPEAVGEKQPHADQETGLVIVFDGRLDNREELLGMLPGSRLSSGPDCAIVLRAFAKLGECVLEQLAGDYALAIWDPAKRRLFCTRSPVGWRPLLWTFQGNRFAFATEPATLIRGLALERRVNEGAIAEYLALRFVTETETFWRDLRRLPPGSAAAIENGRLRTWRWHNGPFEDLSHTSDADLIDRFVMLFDQALIAAMRSQTPVASHLSGGLDSSSVVCRSHSLLSAQRLDRSVHPISTRFPGENCDEGEWIEAVEAHCGVQSEMVEGAAFSTERTAEWCSRTLHLPLRPNVHGTIAAVCDRLKEHGIRVLLTGEGGDDWLNGSRAHWPDLLLSGRWGALLREGLAAFPSLSRARSLAVLAMQSVGPLLSRSRRMRLLHPHLDLSDSLPKWINRDWARHCQLAERWRAIPKPPPLNSFAQLQRYRVYSFPRRSINTDNVLCYASSRGIELRHPFHDLRLTRFLMGAPGAILQRRGVRKYLLREGMRGILPELVRNRASKADISGPIIDWTTARIAERPIHEMTCVKLGWVNAEQLQHVQDVHATWRRNNADAPMPEGHYGAVWNAIAMDLWLEHGSML